MDAIYYKVRENGCIIKWAAYVVLRVIPDGKENRHCCWQKAPSHPYIPPGHRFRSLEGGTLLL